MLWVVSLVALGVWAWCVARDEEVRTYGRVTR